MPRVLVVDDSKMDRMLVTELLAAEEDLELDLVEGGEAALTRIEEAPPDMVLTDLVMPGMDGLALVAAIRERHASIPTVLMTSQGNEEIAVQALKLGASSYVPKRHLASTLRDTVREVLDLAASRRAHERLLATLTRSESEFRLENRQDLVRPLVKHLKDVAAMMDLCDETERMQVSVALCEALNNALEHGNLEVPQEVRAGDPAEHVRMLAERREQEPYRDRRIHVAARFDAAGAQFVVRDDGAGFDPDLVPDPLAPGNTGKFTGRGVKLIRSFMDEVTYSDRGNQVTMVKYRIG